MRILVALLLCSPLAGQNFQIVPSTAPSGKSGSLLITLSSPTGKEPVALQFKLLLPSDMTATADQVLAGDAAMEAGKNITCAATPGASKIGVTFKCILVGGVKHISNGTVVLVKYQIKPTAGKQVLQVNTTESMAVLGDGTQLQQVEIAPAHGTVTVR